ncbi:unnamed protein product [Brassicogethes aeneus]|uniref:Uncharacterized protein n=1 Tax=Brassicogethes aeneus TaxID=1431903 RepID=A0A9P0FLK2_BRAAE|nr:unnamed protein product [Brassicogethes aeneus]
MKTYSRKKLEDNSGEDIIDLNELCRLCMTKEDELISIFTNEEAVPLTLRIMACVALEVFEGDGLPDKICHPCKYQLEKSYNFRKKCENSDMKLRQHVLELQEYNEPDQDEDPCEEQEEITEIHEEQEPMQSTSAEQDLVQSTIVKYIQADNDDNEQEAENITLSSETDKEACTLKSAQMKTELVETEEGENIYIMESTDSLDDPNMDAIADAVKATLANQPGINLNGPLQLKVNQTAGKSTQVEVTTEDGSVIVMELMTEEDADAPPLEPPPMPEDQQDQPQFNDDGEIKIFKCPDCPKSFARRIQLRRHASVHMQQRGFSCGICEKWFPTRSALVRHERIHTGERPFQCEVCQKSFAQKEILFRHLMTHTGQKPYSCPHCPRGFTQKEPLKVHLRTHMNNPSDIQLHYCSLCPKVFCHASGLSRHLVTHTGKTFKCGDCDKTFTDKSSLRRHHVQSLHHA